MRYATIKDHNFRDPRYLLLQTEGLTDMPALHKELNTIGAKVLTVIMELVLTKADTNLATVRNPYLNPNWIIIEAVESILFIIKYSNCILANMGQEEIETGLTFIRALADQDKLAALGIIHCLNANPISIKLIRAKVAMIESMMFGAEPEAIDILRRL